MVLSCPSSSLPVTRFGRQKLGAGTSVSEMSSEAESLEVKSVAEGKDEVRAHKAMTDKPDDVGQLPKKSALQPLMLSPDLLSGHGEFGCTICGERCFSLAQLAKHVQFHDRDRPFPCAICGKRFLSRSHHAEHQRVHTGERPFPCNRCERAFTTHHNLKRHQLIHDKEEMYRCSVCGVLFCQEHQLGNIGGIIRVLKQHNMEDLIDPQQLLEPESVPEAEPAVETIPNLSLKTILKEEQNVRKKKRKHENLHSDEDHSPFADREGKNSQLSFHSEVPQIHTSEEKDFSDLVRRTGPRIQKIAYDIEIIL
ncbi:zinc finger protein 19-like isoform X2 [Colossoma macropomum]|uniref:zinc finger protein 19-like isoform X2 n=1 Tax=Colossoma macropomum TaxID=42526 RepID=UPI00186429F2|nr:zinc finger protein 19-like isoform X2 [Colossoma macropomum]